MTSQAGALRYADRYRVVRRLGAGGMATVYLAEDERLGRRVAVKRLHADSPEDVARRFDREARIGASLNHPNLVAVYDTLTDPEGVLIVMEYVDGSTLAAGLKDGPLPPDRALAVLRETAAALDHAHRHGIIHRDVKPANILLAADGRTKLADLGIAFAAERATHITRTGTVLGTPSYMAPEQLEGRDVEPAADVYALATVAFEALAGRKARTGGSPLEIAHRVATEPAPELREPWPEAPQRASEVLCQGMAFDPSDRPGSAGELVDRLEVALEGVGEGETAPAESGGAGAAAAAGAAAGAAGAGAVGAGTDEDAEVDARDGAVARHDAEPEPRGEAQALAEPGVGRSGNEGSAAPAPPAREPAPSEPPEHEPAEREPPAREPPAREPPAREPPAREPPAREPAERASAAAAAAAAAPAAERPPSSRPAPPSRPSAGAPASRRPRPAWLAPVALLLVLGAAAVAVILSTGGGGTQSQGGESGAPGVEGGRSDSAGSDGGGAAEGAGSGAGAGAAAAAPAQTVTSFYERAAADDFDGAWALAGPGFRSQLGGYDSFRGGLSTLESIRFEQAEPIASDGDSAQVAIRSVATHTDGVDRCQGTVSLTRVGPSGWLIERADVACPESTRG